MYSKFMKDGWCHAFFDGVHLYIVAGKPCKPQEVSEIGKIQFLQFKT